MLTVLFAVSSLMTAPVYLECQMTTSMEGETPPSTAWDWKVTINEAEGRVDYIHPRATQTVRAVFTANEVTFDGFSINRTDLTFTRNFDFIGEIKTSRGKCRLASAPERAF